MSDKRITVWCCINGAVEPHAARNTGDPAMVELIRRGRFKTRVRVGDPAGAWFRVKAHAMERAEQILREEWTYHTRMIADVNHRLFRLRNGI